MNCYEYNLSSIFGMSDIMLIYKGMEIILILYTMKWSFVA